MDLTQNFEVVTSFITEQRNNVKYRDRIFTANNNRLQQSMHRYVGKKGIEMVLNKHGKKILWIKLRDNIERCHKNKVLTSSSSPNTNPSEDRDSYRRKDALSKPRPRNSIKNDRR